MVVESEVSGVIRLDELAKGSPLSNRLGGKGYAGCIYSRRHDLLLATAITGSDTKLDPAARRWFVTATWRGSLGLTATDMTLVSSK